MKEKKGIFSVLGIILCAVISLVGLLMLFGAFGPKVRDVYTGDVTTSDVNPQSLEKYGTGTFGADFYTFVNNNAAIAARGSITVGDNIYELSEFLRKTFGIMFIFFGLFGMCYFKVKQFHNEIIYKCINENIHEILYEIKPPIECPNCHTINKSNRQTCCQCGEKLDYDNLSINEYEGNE